MENLKEELTEEILMGPHGSKLRVQLRYNLGRAMINRYTALTAAASSSAHVIAMHSMHTRSGQDLPKTGPPGVPWFV